MISDEIKEYINYLNDHSVQETVDNASEKSDIQKMILLTYDECCDFLIKKYGAVPGDYFLNEGMKTINPKIKRTSEGLQIHHIDEDKAIMLSNQLYAKDKPFDFQKANRLVYCNLLEHYLLHIKIVEYPNENQYPGEEPGTGGVVNFIGPELNDIFSGFQYNVAYKIATANLVKDKIKDYLLCVKKWKDTISNNPRLKQLTLLKSFNEQYGNWTDENNKDIYEMIDLIK